MGPRNSTPSTAPLCNAGKISPAGSDDSDRTQLLEDVGGEADGADLEAFQVGLGLELAAEPAAHLHAGAAGHEGLEAEGGVELVPQRLAAAMLDPGDMLERGQAPGNGGEVGGGTGLAGPVDGGAVAHLGDTGVHGVEHLKAGHEFARGVELDGETAAAHGGDPLGQAAGVHAGTGQVARPGGDHAPGAALLGAHDGGCGNDGAGGEEGAAGEGSHRGCSSCGQMAWKWWTGPWPCPTPSPSAAAMAAAR